MRVYYGDAIDPSSTTTSRLIPTRDKTFTLIKTCTIQKLVSFSFFFFFHSDYKPKVILHSGKNPAGEGANPPPSLSMRMSDSRYKKHVSQVQIVMERAHAHTHTLLKIGIWN